MPEFYIIIARKIFFPNSVGARVPLPPVSYAYVFAVRNCFTWSNDSNLHKKSYAIQTEWR